SFGDGVESSPVIIVAQAIPVPFDLVINGDSANGGPITTDGKLTENAERIQKAGQEADRIMGNMQQTIDKAYADGEGSDSVESARMKAAFGDNWRNNHAAIKDTMTKMKDSTMAKEGKKCSEDFGKPQRQLKRSDALDGYQ
ncbi:17580_t:CDS:2, partial [Acaulospora colombiana]